MKIAPKLFSVYLVISLLLMINAPAFAGFEAGKINYIAFGDSVASGVRAGVKEKGSNHGYTDIVANYLNEAGVLSEFNKDFCNIGMTAKLLAENTNVLNDKNSLANNLVKNADIATLSVGANDILFALNEYLNFNLDSRKADAKIKEAFKAVSYKIYDGYTAPRVQADVETVLQNILNANPNIKIFVMGYYNPLPSAAILLGVDINTPLKDFNIYIKNAVENISKKNEGASITYIDTMSAIAANSVKSLLFKDIHPTEDGYRIIANEFWKKIEPIIPECLSRASESNSSIFINNRIAVF